MKKRLIALLLAMNMVMLSVSGCGLAGDINEALQSEDGAGQKDPAEELAEEMARDAKSVVPDSQGWIDSDIRGYFKEDTPVSLKDDFAAAANKELYLQGDLNGAMIEDFMRRVHQKKRALLNDASVTGPDIEKVRTFVNLAEDEETRNVLGVEPLRPYVTAIENISTTEELYAWITDTRLNPLGVAPASVNGMARSEVEPDSYFVSISMPALMLGSSDAYFSVGSQSLMKMDALEDKAERVLTGLGYDDAEITGILQKNYQMEKILTGMQKDLSNEDEEDVTFTREEIEFIQGSYPMIRFLDNWGFGQCGRFMTDSDYVRKLDNLCERNLEKIKAMCLLRYVVDGGYYLDVETHDFFEECDQQKGVTPIADRSSEEERHEAMIFDQLLGKTPLEGALDAEYVRKYVDPDSYDRLYGMTEDIINEFRIIFENEKWLSEEGRQACLDKLNEIKIHVVYQDEGDYSDLQLLEAEEGGNFLDAHYAVSRFDMMKRAEMSAGRVNRDAWSPYMYELSTGQTNAFYYAQTNGIYILAGILEDPAYYPGMSDEELLGGIGTIVGHEITHGFDKNGVKYDKDGVNQKWLGEEDQKAFEDATSKVAMYYLSLKPFSGSGPYNGTNVQGEATADMGGIRVTLALADKIPGFDHDKFFRAYARLWATQRSLDEERGYMAGDSHPLNFYRINVVLSQFDKFHETYGIKEGDGMYVAPDKRIAVW